jgi:hypothetical protein
MRWIGLFAVVLLGAASAVACDRSTPKETPTTTPSSEPPAAPSQAVSAPEADDAPPASATASIEVPPVQSAAPKSKTAATATTHLPIAAVSTAPSAPPRAVKAVSGSSQSSDAFLLTISASSPVKAGQTSQASVILTARDPYHCNPKYPYKFALNAPSAGVSYPSNPVRGMSVTEKRANMAVPFSAADKGHATVSGTLSFSICTEDKCLIEKRPLSVSVDVD